MLLSIGAGTSIVLLGAAAIMSWYSDSMALVQLRTGYASMRFNTALGFVISGCALVLAALGWRRLVDLLAALVLVGALLTLAQYAFAIDLGIDRAFFQRWGDVGDALPDRPAPNTAVCFALAGGALLLIGRVPALAWGFGALVFVLGSVAVVGYVSAVRPAFSWGTGPEMTVYTAIAFVVLGAGVLLTALPRSRARSGGLARWTPQVAGTVAMLAAVLFWQALVAQQNSHIRRSVETTALTTLVELSAQLRSVIGGLERLATRWQKVGRPSAADWQYETGLILGQVGGPFAVEWIGPDLAVREIATRPDPARRALLEALVAPGEDERHVFEEARTRRGAVAGEPVVVDEDLAAFRVVVPLVRDDEFEGYLAGLFLTDGILNAVVTSRTRDYVIGVDSGNTRLYRSVGWSPGAPGRWARQHTLELPGDRTWTLVVAPSPALLAAIDTALPEIVLAGGLLISFLLMATLRLVYTATQAARELTATNRRLNVEVAERRRAEEEVRALARSLEERVATRTAELASANEALRNENALRQKAQTTLAQANDDLQQFASFVSHELRQPLGSMQIWAELLQSTAAAALGARGQHYVTQLRASIKRMSTFIESQLRLSHAAYGEVAIADALDVAALVREVAADMPGFAEGDRVEVGEVPVVRADPDQMRQLFRNLLENAVKYRRPAVALTVRVHGTVRRGDGQPAVCEICVEDNGQGFAPEDGEHIFAMFRRLEGSGARGSGIGLAICRRIVDHHGGSIRAVGRPGEGATFVIELPLDRCEAPAAETPGAAASASGR